MRHCAMILALLIAAGCERPREDDKDKAETPARESAKRDETPKNVATNVKGQFAMAKGVMQVSSFTFAVPGAVVSLAGQCNFNTRALALRGELQMETTISKAVGGFKSIFLRVVDPFFKKAGRGTVVPIKVEGRIDAPEVGLNLRNKH